MSFLRNLATAFFGKSIEVVDLKMAFHKEANNYGTHGVLIADHIDQKLENYPVRFAFIGASKPPAMTPRVVSHIWEEARAQGYLPQCIQHYGSAIEISAKDNEDALTNERLRQEAFSANKNIREMRIRAAEHESSSTQMVAKESAVR